MTEAELKATITEENWQQFVEPVVDGEKKAHGLVMRNWKKRPLGHYASESEFPDDLLIHEDEWEDRLKEQWANKASLIDLRNASGGKLDSLDQGQHPFCWCFSTTKCVMYIEAIEGQKVEKLSAWWLEGQAADWHSRGGNGSESLDAAVKLGIPTYDKCPSWDHKKYDTPEVKANAALRCVTEWWAGSRDTAKRRKQAFTAWCIGLPIIGDWDFWSHSTAVPARKSVKGASVVDNSWSNSAGENGLYYITKNDGIPDDIWIPRVIRAAAA